MIGGQWIVRHHDGGLTLSAIQHLQPIDAQLIQQRRSIRAGRLVWCFIHRLSDILDECLDPSEKQLIYAVVARAAWHHRIHD